MNMPDSPPVHGKSVTFPRNHLGGHAVGRSAVRVRFLEFSVATRARVANIFCISNIQLLRATQIDQFHMATRIQHDVVCFYVAMHEAVIMHVRDRRSYFGGVKLHGWHLPNGGDDRLGQARPGRPSAPNKSLGIVEQISLEFTKCSF